MGLNHMFTLTDVLIAGRRLDSESERDLHHENDRGEYIMNCPWV